MSGVKHTPERWEIAGQYVRTPFVVGIGGGLMIADVGHGVWSAEEHAANARLIAAAPDLLAVCVAIAPYLGATDENDWRGLKDDDAIAMPVKMRVGDLRALKAVITKATAGETRNAEGAL